MHLARDVENNPYFRKLYLEYQTTENIWFLSKYYYGILLCTLDSDNLLAVYDKKQFFHEFAVQNIFLHEMQYLNILYLKTMELVSKKTL